MKRSLLLEDLILTFLNHDFDAADAESMKVRMRLEIEWGFFFQTEGFEWIPNARALQTELKNDLVNVLTPEGRWWEKEWAKASPGCPRSH